LSIHSKHRAHERLQHHDEEYGGPFWMDVSPKMKIDDLRKAIAEKCGIMPGMQKLSFAGKNFEDSQRTLEQCVPLSSPSAAPLRVTHVQACASLLPHPQVWRQVLERQVSALAADAAAALKDLQPLHRPLHTEGGTARDLLLG
jgi:hypothetical protein